MNLCTVPKQQKENSTPLISLSNQLLKQIESDVLWAQTKNAITSAVAYVVVEITSWKHLKPCG